MGLTVFMIVLFGAAILVPATWSIVGLVRGKPGSWPCIVGIAWAVLLLGITFVEIGTKWSGCSSSSATSEGAIKCFTRDTPTGCNPDVWKLECGKPPGCPGIPAGEFCPRGQTPVFPFCEAFQHGAVKQPWATWSDLSFVAAGLWLLWLFQYFGRPGTTTTGGTDSISISMTADNPMITIGWLSITYCFIVIFMGPPSMWYHASMKEWAGWFDSMSVVIWLMFNAVYVGYALIFAMWGKRRGAERPIFVLLTWGLFVIVYGIIAAKWPHARLYLYFASGGPWGIVEVIYIFVAAFASGVIYRRTWWLFISNLVLLAVTMGIWMAFNDNVVHATTCQGHEGFPGHALFHILASFSTMLTFFSFASERSVSAE